jgi:NCAIR mutase (PurE)-related protein
MSRGSSSRNGGEAARARAGGAAGVRGGPAASPALDREGLALLLDDVRAGRVGVPQALERLARFPAEDLGHACLDHGRELRTGIPEAVLADGKTTAQTVSIARRVLERQGRVLVTRAGRETADALVRAIPGARSHELARTVVAGRGTDRVEGRVAVVSAGTSDLPVAEEAAETLSFLGRDPVRVVDVGVAGLHRLLSRLEEIRGAGVVVVAAGMEGALPSVVAGLVEAPVVAVPTSVGYGASFDGLAALLAMLNACAPGVSVVNIDNGFGAACTASRILAARRPAGGPSAAPPGSR